VRLAALLCLLGAAGCARSTQAPVRDAGHPAATGRRGLSRVEVMLRRAEALGYEMARVTLTLNEIPEVQLPPMLEAHAAGRGATASPEGAWDLSGLAFVEEREGVASCGPHEGEVRPFCASCQAAGRSRSRRAEGPRRGSGVRHVVDYEFVDGNYDIGAHQDVGETRKTRVSAKEVLPHLVYAFRFAHETEPGVALVSLVMPPAVDISVSRSRPVDPRDEVDGSFRRTTLPVRPGGSESVVARLTGEATAAWIAGVSPGAPPLPQEDLVVGVELSQTGSEPKPQLVAWVSRVHDAPPP